MYNDAIGQEGGRDWDDSSQQQTCFGQEAKDLGRDPLNRERKEGGKQEGRN